MQLLPNLRDEFSDFREFLKAPGRKHKQPLPSKDFPLEHTQLWSPRVVLYYNFQANMVERVDLKWRHCCPGLYICCLSVAGSLVNSLADWVQLVCSGSSLSRFPSPEGGIQGKSVHNVRFVVRVLISWEQNRLNCAFLVFEPLSPFKDFTQASNQKLCTNI